MYKYEEPSIFSGTRGAALIAVIILHIGIVWAFYTGLAGKLIQKVIPPVEIAQIDKPKEVDKPPPPPPKLEEVKPYVPPPEFVDIQAPVQETTAITQTTQVQKQAPPPPAPVVQHSRTPPSPDPKHPFPNSDDYYPDASRRAGEEGVCTVQLTVGVDGKITNAAIDKSSSFPRLDEACLKLVRASGVRLKPAQEDGKPIESSVSVPIRWKLSGK
jgi:periplasmic protein TonB